MRRFITKVSGNPKPRTAASSSIMRNEETPWEILQVYRRENLPDVVLIRGSVLDFSSPRGCIVNAANEGCLGGGGVDGAITSAGGPLLARHRLELPILNNNRSNNNKRKTSPVRTDDDEKEKVDHTSKAAVQEVPKEPQTSVADEKSLEVESTVARIILANGAATSASRLGAENDAEHSEIPENQLNDTEMHVDRTKPKSEAVPVPRLKPNLVDKVNNGTMNTGHRTSDSEGVEAVLAPIQKDVENQVDTFSDEMNIEPEVAEQWIGSQQQQQEVNVPSSDVEPLSESGETRILVTDKKAIKPSATHQKTSTNFFDDNRGRSPIRCRTGSAVVTGPGNYGRLDVNYVIHAVGPNYWDYAPDDIEEGHTHLHGAYQRSLDLAHKVDGIDEIAFCLLSAGVFRGSIPLLWIIERGLRAISKWRPPSGGPEAAGTDTTATTTTIRPSLHRIYVTAFTERECLLLVKAGHQIFGKGDK